MCNSYVHAHASNSNKRVRGATHDRLRLAGKLTRGSNNSPHSTTRAHSIAGSRNKKVVRGHSARTRIKQKRAHCIPPGTEALAKQCERASRDAATPRSATKLEMKRLSRSGAALRARASKAHHKAHATGQQYIFLQVMSL